MKNKVGRPRELHPKDLKISFKVTAEEFDSINNICKSESLTKSSLIRGLLFTNKEDDSFGYIKNFDFKRINTDEDTLYYLKSLYHFSDFKKLSLDFLQKENLNDDSYIERSILIEYKNLDSLVYNYLEDNEEFDFENVADFMSEDKMRKLKGYLNRYFDDSEYED